MTPNEFAALARDVFAFLELEYAFVFSCESRYMVRFDSPKVFVNVGYDATRSYELCVLIGRRADVEWKIEYPFELWTMLRAVGQGELFEAKGAVQSLPGDLRKYLERLAELVREHTGDLLIGDIEAFRNVNRQWDTDIAAYALETALRYARRDAEKAWKEGKYQEVVKAFEPVVEHLLPCEKKKLVMARKRAQLH